MITLTFKTNHNKRKGKDMKTSLNILLLTFMVGSISIALARKGQPADKSLEKGWTDTFILSEQTFLSTGTNPYFILQPGYNLVLEGKEGDNEVRLVVSVLEETEVVDGVKTRVVEERESKNGEVVEISRNFYAIDRTTNSVFYFGEDVDIYRNGKIVGHEGGWRSGENDARYGLMMPGLALIGSRFYQEFAKDVALDRAEIISTTDSIAVPAGQFSNCVKFEETTPLEPGVKEYKYYAPGVGLIRDGDLVLVKYGFIKPPKSAIKK